jgi:hypothetical protein
MSYIVEDFPNTNNWGRHSVQQTFFYIIPVHCILKLPFFSTRHSYHAQFFFGQSDWKKIKYIQETTFIEQLVEDETHMEGIPAGCSKIMNLNLRLEDKHLVYPKGWQLAENLDVISPLWASQRHTVVIHTAGKSPIILVIFLPRWYT